MSLSVYVYLSIYLTIYLSIYNIAPLTIHCPDLTLPTGAAGAGGTMLQY